MWQKIRGNKDLRKATEFENYKIIDGHQKQGFIALVKTEARLNV